MIACLWCMADLGGDVSQTAEFGGGSLLLHLCQPANGGEQHKPAQTPKRVTKPLPNHPKPHFLFESEREREGESVCGNYR